MGMDVRTTKTKCYESSIDENLDSEKIESNMVAKIG